MSSEHDRPMGAQALTGNAAEATFPEAAPQPEPDLTIDEAEPAAAQTPEAAPDAAAGAQAPEAAATPPAGFDEEPWEQVVASYEREAQARAQEPAATRLWHEAGLIHAFRLGQPRQAAVCFQTAFKIDPSYRPNIQAARALFAEVGNWGMVANLLKAEADVSTDAAHKAALLFERAVLLHDRLGRTADAVALLDELTRTSPGDASLTKYLENLATRSGDYARMADVYRGEAEKIASAPIKVAVLCAAAGLYADRLADPDTALALYDEAHRLDPGHPVPLEALQRLRAARGDDEALVALLRAEAESAATPAEAAAALFEAARIARGRLARPEEAIALLEAAREKAPEDPTVLTELASGYEHQQLHDKLADVLRALTGVLLDPRTLAETWHQLGALLDEKLQREDEAADAYREMLEVRAGAPEALAALGKLYFRGKRWDDLIWTFQQEMAATSDPKQRASRLFRIAEIQELHVGRADDAVATLRRILEESPGYLPAIQALTRLYEVGERWEDLIALLEADLESLGDSAQRVVLLDRIARVRDERMEDRAGAAAAYERILELSPEHLPAVHALARLYEALERWTDLIRVIEREADLVDDQRQVISLLHRTCEIVEDKLGDKDAAIEAYKKLLNLQPNYLPALKALGKLYYQKGRWTELVEMFRMELEVTQSSEHVVSLLLKMGELYEVHILDEERAVGCYREVLEQQPENLLALRALARLHERRGEWDKVVEVLRRDAEVAEDPTQKALVLCRAAELRETAGNRPDQAVETYLEALEHHPGHVPALRALARLYGAAGAWRELAAVYERALSSSPPGRRAPAFRHLAHLYLDRLDEPTRAIQCLEAVLTETPDDAVAITILERLHTAAGQHAKATGMRERLAARAESPEVAAALLRTAALSHEHLDDPPTAAGTLWKRALEFAPADVMAARRVESELQREGDHQTLLALYRAQRERADADDVRLALSMRIGDLCAEYLHDAPTAETSYREALALAPDHLPAIRGLKRVLAARGKWDEVQQLLEREGETARDPERSVALLFEAGVLREEHLRDTAAAETNYRKVLERAPTEPRAHERLCGLLQAQSRWADLGDAHAARARHLTGPTERARAWMRAALVFETHLHEPVRALAAAEQALEATPDAPEVLQRAGDLAFALSNWDKAAALFGRRVDLGGNPEELIHARLHLGRLYQDHLRDPQRAASCFKDVLTTDRGNVEALRRLADLYRAAQNWAGTASVLAALAEVEPDRGRKVTVLLELAGLHADHRRDPNAAVQALEQVRTLDPHNVGAIERLGALYESQRAYDKLVETYAAFIKLLPADQKDRAFPLHMRMAELFATVYKDANRAIQEYRSATHIRPRELPPRLAVAAMYERQPDLYSQAIDEHRAILEIDPFRVDSYHALYRLFEAQKQFDKAFCVTAVLHFFKGCDQEEGFFYTENRSHAPQETGEVLSPSDHANMLRHVDARTPLSDVLSVLVDQLAKVHPADLGRFQVGKAERLTVKDSSPLRRLCDGLATVLGAGDFDVYRADKAPTALAALPGDPPAVVVGNDVIRRHPVKEQRFLLGRLLEHVRSGSALAVELETGALASTVQAAVQVVLPDFQGLAPADPDLTRRCGKSMSRKGRKALEDPARGLAAAEPPDLERFIRGSQRTADRAGLLLSGDIEATLGLLAAEGGRRTFAQPSELTGNQPLQDLLQFVISDDFFRLRQRLKLSIG